MPHTLSPQLLDARARVITREHTAEITESAGRAVRQLARHLLELPAEARFACYRIADVAHALETTIALQRESWRRDSLDSIALRRARAEGKMMDLAHAALFTHRQAAHRHDGNCLQNAKHRAAANSLRDVIIPAIAASPELAYASITSAPSRA